MENKYNLELNEESNYEVITDYIKDVSIEIPTYETYVETKLNNLKSYETRINIKSIQLENRIIEIECKVALIAPDEIKKKIRVEVYYGIIFKFNNIKKLAEKEVKKIIIAEIPNLFKEKITTTISELFKIAGFDNFKFKKEIDFIKLYEDKNN